MTQRIERSRKDHLMENLKIKKIDNNLKIWILKREAK